MEKRASDSEFLEKQMMEVLKNGGLEKEHPSELIKIAAEVTAKSGIRIDDVFPVGFPWPDLIGFETTIETREALGRFFDEVAASDMVRQIGVFKKDLIFQALFGIRL